MHKAALTNITITNSGSATFKGVGGSFTNTGTVTVKVNNVELKPGMSFPIPVIDVTVEYHQDFAIEFDDQSGIQSLVMLQTRVSYAQDVLEAQAGKAPWSETLKNNC